MCVGRAEDEEEPELRRRLSCFACCLEFAVFVLVVVEFAGEEAFWEDGAAPAVETYAYFTRASSAEDGRGITRFSLVPMILAELSSFVEEGCIRMAMVVEVFSEPCNALSLPVDVVVVLPIDAVSVVLVEEGSETPLEGEVVEES